MFLSPQNELAILRPPRKVFDGAENIFGRKCVIPRDDDDEG
jgi:hypothetical protein